MQNITMTITKDPKDIKTTRLFGLASFQDKQVLEIGCGDGNLTWQYAKQADYVTAIDPEEEDISWALDNTPQHLINKIFFQSTSFEDFSAPDAIKGYDLILFGWSL